MVHLFAWTRRLPFKKQSRGSLKPTQSVLTFSISQNPLYLNLAWKVLKAPVAIAIGIWNCGRACFADGLEITVIRLVGLVKIPFDYCGYPKFQMWFLVHFSLIFSSLRASIVYPKSTLSFIRRSSCCTIDVCAVVPCFKKSTLNNRFFSLGSFRLSPQVIIMLSSKQNKKIY